MYRVIDAKGVKRLKSSTTIYVIDNEHPERMDPYTLVQSGNKKMLKDKNGDLMPVRDYQGMHYEVEV